MFHNDSYTMGQTFRKVDKLNLAKGLKAELHIFAGSRSFVKVLDPAIQWKHQFLVSGQI